MPEPSVREKIDICLLHAERLIALKGPRVGVLEMRKHAAWYLKGLRGSTHTKNLVNAVETEEELRRVLTDYVEWVENYAGDLEEPQESARDEAVSY